MILAAIDWTPVELALSAAALAIITAAVPLIKAWLDAQTAAINAHTTQQTAPPAQPPTQQPPAAGGQ